MAATDLPVTVHVRHAPYDLYIGRAMPYQGIKLSKWANPHRIIRKGDRDMVLRLYEQHVRSRPDLMAALPELCGLRLGCWCAKPDQVLTADDPLICHGQVLSRLCREMFGGGDD